MTTLPYDVCTNVRISNGVHIHVVLPFSVSGRSAIFCGGRPAEFKDSSQSSPIPDRG